MKDESFGLIPFFRHPKGIQFLLIQHRYGARHWAFPKGHREGEESGEEAAKREFEEETGITKYRLFPTSEVFEESYTFFDEQHSVRVEKKVRYFLAETFTQELHVQQEEILSARWATPEEALTILSFPEGKALCKQALTALS
jgi:8-oxo-dGTP pyrophosphatase MutT (NUDIX family)